MYLVVGLGNPSKEYLTTFHNVGFMVVDCLAKKLNVGFDKGECQAVTAHAKINNEKVIIAKPITFMNLSGNSVIELINKYKIERDHFIVVYDDIDLSVGSIRIRFVGSAGTHNGMKSIVNRLNSTEFNRIRIGIGKPEIQEMDLKDFVLSKVDGEIKDKLEPVFDMASNAIFDFVSGIDIVDVMQKYNIKGIDK